MKKTIKTAVIGAGNMGKNHARVYSEISNLTAIADVLPEIGLPLSREYSVPFYQNFEELLEKEQPEALSVVVPTKFHKDVVLSCLSRRISTLVEKPIADSIRNAEEMILTAKKMKTCLMVGHIERFNPAIRKLKKIINSGKLGKIISLLAIRVGVAPPKIANSDVALDLGIHDIDVFNYLLDEFPVDRKVMRSKIFHNNLADSASVLLEYKEARGYIQTNWITPIKMRKLYITGTDGFVELDYITQKLILHDKIITMKPQGDFFEMVSVSDAPKKEVYVSKKEPLKEELQYFLMNRNNDSSQSSYAIKALETLLI